MYTNGIHIINARCNIEQNTPIECEFTLWSITEQQEHIYSVWVSNGEGLSTLKKKKRGEWETIYQGNRWDLANLLQQILSDGHSWTWREFVFYVAGWCDANRK